MGPVPNPNAYYNYVSGICGVVKTNDGNNNLFQKMISFDLQFVIDVKVVVGSGYNDYTGEIMIYSQKDNSFQFGPSLPKVLEGAASVPYGDSFIVVGGYDNMNCYCESSGNTCYIKVYFLMSMYVHHKHKLLSDIYYLNPDGADGWTWELMDVSLSSPRSHHVVFPLETVSGAICNPDIPTVPPAIIPDGMVMNNLNVLLFL